MGFLELVNVSLEHFLHYLKVQSKQLLGTQQGFLCHFALSNFIFGTTNANDNQLVLINALFNILLDLRAGNVFCLENRLFFFIFFLFISGIVRNFVNRCYLCFHLWSISKEENVEEERFQSCALSILAPFVKIGQKWTYRSKDWQSCLQCVIFLNIYLDIANCRQFCKSLQSCSPLLSWLKERRKWFDKIVRCEF